MTDEARDAFTRSDHMSSVEDQDISRQMERQRYRAWLYDARIALESELEHELRYRPVPLSSWSIWLHDRLIGVFDSCDAAIEAGVQDWYERQNA